MFKIKIMLCLLRVDAVRNWSTGWNGAAPRHVWGRYNKTFHNGQGIRLELRIGS